MTNESSEEKYIIFGSCSIDIFALHQISTFSHLQNRATFTKILQVQLLPKDKPETLGQKTGSFQRDQNLVLALLPQ